MKTLTFQSSQTVEYFICQYMADPLRREPRNIGVIACREREYDARFLGEAMGSRIDGRSLRGIRDESAYRQWVNYWRKILSKPDWKKTIVSSGKENYFAIEGGIIDGSEHDSLASIVDYLYAVIVGNGTDSLLPLVDEESEIKSSKQFERRINEIFRKNDLMSNQRREAPGSIWRDVSIPGNKSFHNFSFVQLNGIVRPMEVFDFEHSMDKSLRYHAGWAKTAFIDVKEREQSTQNIVLVYPPESHRNLEAYDYSRKILDGICEVIDMRNGNEVESFVNSCKRFAGLLPLDNSV